MAERDGGEGDDAGLPRTKTGAPGADNPVDDLFRPDRTVPAPPIDDRPSVAELVRWQATSSSLLDGSLPPPPPPAPIDSVPPPAPKPARVTKPAQTSKPAEAPKALEASKPAEAPKVVEASKPAPTAVQEAGPKPQLAEPKAPVAEPSAAAPASPARAEEKLSDELDIDDLERASVGAPTSRSTLEGGDEARRAASAPARERAMADAGTGERARESAARGVSAPARGRGMLGAVLGAVVLAGAGAAWMLARPAETAEPAEPGVLAAPAPEAKPLPRQAPQPPPPPEVAAPPPPPPLPEAAAPAPTKAPSPEDTTAVVAAETEAESAPPRQPTPIAAPRPSQEPPPAPKSRTMTVREPEPKAKPMPTPKADPKVEPAPEAAPTGEAVEDSSKLVLEARKLLDDDEAADAEALMRRLLATEPNSDVAREMLTKALIDQDKGAAAVTEAKKLVTRRPKHVPYWLLFGDAQLLAGDEAAAEQSWRKALELRPADIGAKQRLGM